MNWTVYILSSMSVAVAVAVLRGVFLYREKAKAQAEVYKKLLERVESWDRRWQTLSTEVSPFWAAVQKELGVDLTHPEEKHHTGDELLRKLEALTITLQEREQLKLILKQRTVDNSVSFAERSKAKIMLEVMGLVLDETASREVLSRVQLVGRKGATEAKGE